MKRHKIDNVPCYLFGDGKMAVGVGRVPDTEIWTLVFTAMKSPQKIGEHVSPDNMIPEESFGLSFKNIESAKEVYRQFGVLIELWEKESEKESDKA